MDTPLLLEVFNVISGSSSQESGSMQLTETTTLSLSIAGFILEHFSKLVQHQADQALDIGLQKRFMIKFCLVFDRILSKKNSEGRFCENDQLKLEALIKTITSSLNHIIRLDFLKACDTHELKVLFYSIWNIALEAKNFQMFSECHQMLKSLYENIKKFARLQHEMKKEGMSKRQPDRFDKQQTKSLLLLSPENSNHQSEEILHLILFKTLSLISLMNIELGNFDAAKQAIQDLEYVNKNDANTYVLKIKVIILENTDDEQGLLEAVYEMQKTENFNFTHLLSVLQDLLTLKNKFPDLFATTRTGNALEPLLLLIIDFFSRNQPQILKELKPSEVNEFNLCQFILALTGSFTSELELLIQPILKYVSQTLADRSQAAIEIHEKIKLVIQLNEAKYLANFYWKRFFDRIKSAEMDNFEAFLEKLDIKELG